MTKITASEHGDQKVSGKSEQETSNLISQGHDFLITALPPYNQKFWNLKRKYVIEMIARSQKNGIPKGIFGVWDYEPTAN